MDNIQRLLALQTEDSLHRALQNELKVLLPKRRAEAKARLQAARDAVEAAVQENEAAARTYNRFQDDYNRHRDQMRRSERNAIGLTNARALEAAQREHANAAAEADRAAAEADRAGSYVTPTERKLDEARAFEAQEEAAVQDIYDAIDARKADVEAKAAEAKTRCEAAATEVPADLLAYYTRLKLTRWPCVVEYDRKRNVCPGCNLIQPQSVTQAVLSAERRGEAGTVHCPSCGRILI